MRPGRHLVRKLAARFAPEPSSEVRLTIGDQVHPVAYGGSVALPRGGNGEVVILDRSAPRSVNVGFYHEV